MNQQITKAIVLQRTNYGEADRIVTLITEDFGKLSAMVRGVRKERSKLAGGVELFSVNEVGFLRGKGELVTLVSSRLAKHFGNISSDIDRTMVGYEFLKIVSKNTEHNTEQAYYDLLKQSLESLDDFSIDHRITQLWFSMKILIISGHAPNLLTDNNNKPLVVGGRYNFDHEDMQFVEHRNGEYQAAHIKILRLIKDGIPKKIANIHDGAQYLDKLLLLSQELRRYHLVA